jgi:hypothetical protein
MAQLGEQIGVMAIVDRLRHEALSKSALEEMTEQRDSIRTKVASYYHEKGLAVSDEQISEGIRQYFSQRYSAPVFKPGFIVRTYLRLFRAKPASKGKEKAFFDHVQFDFLNGGQVFASGFMIVITCIVIGWIGYISSDSYRLNRAKEHYEQAITNFSQFKTDAQNVTVSLPEKAPQQYKSRIIDIQEKLSVLMSELEFEKGALDKLPTDTEQLDAYFTKLKSFRRQIGKGQQLVGQVESGITGYEEEIAKQIRAASLHQRIGEQVAFLLSHDLSVDEVELVNRLASEAKANPLKTGAVSTLDAMTAYIEKSLILAVDSDSAGTTGVTRTSNSSGGSSYYVIASAVDALGNKVPVWVVDRESGIGALKSRFAVQVSRDKYRSVGRDKSDDGVVDDKYLGEKPAGRLLIQTDTSSDVSPAYIFRW